MNRKQLDKKLEAIGYDLGTFAGYDTRRLEDNTGLMPETGWKYKVSRDGRLVFKGATLADVEEFLERVTLYPDFYNDY